MSTSSAHVAATAVSTVEWLSIPEVTIVVPVYQRQYRWDIGRCEQLLADIRRAADGDLRTRHFLGSILSASGFASPRSSATAELILIDGQQRLTTLMLLVAALRHALSANPTESPGDAELARNLDSVLHPNGPHSQRLRPHRAWAAAFDAVIEGRESEQAGRFADNYAFFRSQIAPEDVDRIWRGMNRLEHVAITLDAQANAQQIFESLNSTGEPLRDHELIHNYLLMGLSHSQQEDIENRFWVPIEKATGEGIARFWQDALILETGREVEIGGEHGVYAAFRQRFPQTDLTRLQSHASEWLALAEFNRALRDPQQIQEDRLRRALGFAPVIGRSVTPVLLGLLRDHAEGLRSTDVLLEHLSRVESMLVRRALTGLPLTRLSARLCRAAAVGDQQLRDALARVTPSDERVRIAIRFTPLPYPELILARLLDQDATRECVVEHIAPLSPADTWSPDGNRAWSELSDDERNSYRTLAGTLGNLTLLEPELHYRAMEASYAQKRAIYEQSAIAGTRNLAERLSWGTADIAVRTTSLTGHLLDQWPRDHEGMIDDDGLTPILDAHRRRGWPRGWEREFEYVEYRGEHWEVHDVRALFLRVFQRGWSDAHEAILHYSSRRGGPLYPRRDWNGIWHELDADHFLYCGWDAKYMMSAVQGVLEESGIAEEVFVKYSYVADYM